MSLVSTLYAAMLVRLDALYPAASGWTRIPEPYELPDNSDSMLRQGWGLKMGPGRPANGSLACNFHLYRTFTVVLSRECFKLENDGVGKGEVDLALMEDVRTILRDFETNTTLNSGQGVCTYESDNGVTDVRTGDNAFKAVEVNFSVLIIESLT